jgi:transcription elongation GreA/GreB family factor
MVPSIILVEKHIYTIDTDKKFFVFHRIWSTIWWRNPIKETKLLVEFIKNVESRNDYNLADHSVTSHAFTDDFQTVENHIAQTLFIDTENEIATIKTIENKLETQDINVKDQIYIGSKVKVRYINSGKDVIVYIVETANKFELSNGIQKISMKSPLAISILGQKVGDIVKVGNLDNFIEILEINNN